jgi:alpha-beta hydrolase superfamily lysophospholipase
MSGTTMIKSRDGRELHFYDWSVASPRIGVALLHGYAEHAGRYAHVARGLNERGISVFAVDLRGHGKSSGVRGHVDRFEEYHHDVDALMLETQARTKDRPIALLGHSMGALLAIDWLLKGNGRDLAGVVLSSPFLGIALEVNPLKIALGKVTSRLVPQLALSSGLKGKDACRDPAIADLYDRDPLNNKKATTRWFTESMDAIERAHRRAGELDVPLLLLYGGADRIASANATDRFARALRCEGRIVERLADHYHEILNEPKEIRDPLIDRIAKWLLERAEAKAA